MKEEMDSVWNHFHNIVGPEIRKLQVSSTFQCTASLEGYVGEILALAKTIKEAGKV
jgi:hypothetical protein